MSLPMLLLLAPLAHAEGLGLNADVGLATMYNYRGLNMYADSSPKDQNMALAPGVSFTPGVSALTIGYWGSFQLNGENKEANVDLGVGAENDLYVLWAPALSESFTLGPTLYVYTYPFSKWDVVGADFPTYLEPGVSAAWSGPIEVGLAVSYLLSPQSALSDYSYLYLGPTLGWSTDLSEGLSLDLGLKGGYKAARGSLYFNDDNVWDAGLDVGLTWAVNERLYLVPALHGAWTNAQVLEVGEEMMYWGSLNVGTDL